MPLIPFSQEESFGHRAKTTLERTEPEKTLVLMTETSNEAVVSESKATPLRTPMPHLATITTSQEILATPVITQTLLLLTFTPKYDRTTTPAASEH